MKKFLSTSICCLVITGIMQAQSKVFKEVSDEISTSMEAIVQDEALVGYVAFTKLEKASEDSFNYKITIMDENLNDIGTVNFREENLELQAVAFEQDVLCLAYVKSTIKGQQFKSNKAFKAVKDNVRSAVVTQFLNLDGKIIKKNVIPVNIKMGEANKSYSAFGKFTIYTNLKHNIQLTNISQKGFACIYGDDDANQLQVYNTAGELQWKKIVAEAQGYSLLTSKDDILLLSKKEDKKLEGGYSVAMYGVDDNTNYLNYQLTDKEGNALKVLGFGNDPTTGKPYISGNIINEKRGNNFYTGMGMSKGAYDGVFTIHFDGRKKSDVKEIFSYWSDESQMPAISKRGKLNENKSYMRFARSFTDYKGNTYFAGSSFTQHVKIGSVVSIIVFAPLLVVSPIILASGIHKCKVRDAVLLKQSPTGVLTVENSVEANKSSFFKSNVPFEDARKYYPVSNSTTKNNYLIIDDVQDIVIYNVDQKKVARTISHKDGKSTINIFPAKEGHIMVSEFNKREKYTRLSIESL